MQRSLILEHAEIELKIKRLAWQICEEYLDSKSIVLIGIRERGSRIAELLFLEMEKIAKGKTSITHVSINKDQPLKSAVEIEDHRGIKGSAVVLVDDVLNSGVTLSGVLTEVLNYLPDSVKVAVLANRDHKAFPIKADFVGISLATTMKEHIAFEEKKGKMAIYLD